MVHYRIRKIPLPDSLVSQMNPAYTPISHSFKVHFNIVFHVLPGIPSDLFLSDFQTKIPYTFLTLPMCVTCAAHLVFHYLMTLVPFCQECSKTSPIQTNWERTFVQISESPKLVIKWNSHVFLGNTTLSWNLDCIS
jgi:hypothetical protein